MSDITTGIIYKIICKLNHKFCYIGSTFDTLRNRWQRHKRHYSDWVKDSDTGKCSCAPYFKKYGIENFKVIEIKSYDIHLKDRRCLEAFETLWINNTRGCCNKILPVRYLEKEQKKQYQQENRESIAEQRKQFRQNNRESIAQKRAVKVTCDCGSFVTKDHMARHCRSAKHQKYLTAQKE